MEGLTDNESLSTSALLERKVAALIEREQAVRATEREAEREAAAADARRAREGDRAAEVEKELELVARRMFYAGCVGLPWLLAMMLMYFWKEYRDEEASPVIKSCTLWGRREGCRRGLRCGSGRASGCGCGTGISWTQYWGLALFPVVRYGVVPARVVPGWHTC